METEKPKSLEILSILFIIISLIHVFYASCSQRALEVDGSVYFINLLNNISNGLWQFYSDSNHPRNQVQWIIETPLLFSGLILHIKSKLTLAVIYSFGAFFTPLIALFWNYELTKRTKQYAVLFWSIFCYACVILLYQNFSIVETIIGVPLQFILLNYLLGNIKYTKLDKIGIAFLIFVMFGVYEHTIFLGIIMFFTMLYIIKKEKDVENKLTKIIIGTGCLAASVYTLCFVLSNSSEHSDFLRFLQEAVFFEQYAFSINFGITVITALIMSFLIFEKKTLTPYKISVIICVYVCYLCQLLTNLDSSLVTIFEIQTRSIICWLVPLIFAGIVIYRIKNQKSQGELIKKLYIPVLIGGIFLSLWQIVHTYFWNKNIAFMKKELQSCEKILYIPDEHENEISSWFNPELRRYIWMANYPSTALALTKEYKVKKFLMPYNSYEDENNSPFRENMYAFRGKNILNIPYDSKIDIKGKFWDLSDVAIEIEKYNKENNIKINFTENE